MNIIIVKIINIMILNNYFIFLILVKWLKENSVLFVIISIKYVVNMIRKFF